VDIGIWWGLLTNGASPRRPCGLSLSRPPLLATGRLAPGLLSFSPSFDDDVFSSFTAGETVTLPLDLAGACQRKISPQIQALSTLVLLVSGVLLILATPRSSGSGRR
jgi:spermidine/putrescine transport system permease protein